MGYFKHCPLCFRSDVNSNFPAQNKYFKTIIFTYNFKCDRSTDFCITKCVHFGCNRENPCLSVYRIWLHCELFVKLAQKSKLKSKARRQNEEQSISYKLQTNYYANQ